jgi:hypothetical protein
MNRFCLNGSQMPYALAMIVILGCLDTIRDRLDHLLHVVLSQGLICLEVIKLPSDPRQDDRDPKMVFQIHGFQKILGRCTCFVRAPPAPAASLSAIIDRINPHPAVQNLSSVAD